MARCGRPRCPISGNVRFEGLRPFPECQQVHRADTEDPSLRRQRRDHRVRRHDRSGHQRHGPGARRRHPGPRTGRPARDGSHLSLADRSVRPGRDRLRGPDPARGRGDEGSGAAQGRRPALARAGGLWRRIRERPRGRGGNPRHDACPSDRDPLVGDLPHLHDRLPAGLHLSRRARQADRHLPPGPAPRQDSRPERS